MIFKLNWDLRKKFLTTFSAWQKKIDTDECSWHFQPVGTVSGEQDGFADLEELTLHVAVEIAQSLLTITYASLTDFVTYLLLQSLAVCYFH